MFEILFFSIVFTFLYTPYGILIEKGSNIRSFSLQLIFSLIILSFFSLLINFFIPISKNVNSIFLIIGFFLILKYKRSYLKKKYIIFSIFSGLIIFLLISNSNVYRPDAGLYHLPYINIINEEKIIIGAANLHFRFGHTSILQYTSAIFNNLLFSNNGIVFPSAAIASAVIINFLSNINRNLKIKNFNFYFFLILSLLIFIFYKVNRYSEYGNDAPAHLILFILFAEIIKNYKRMNFDNFLRYFLLSIFIIMNKIILLLSIFLPFIFFLKRTKNIDFFNPKILFIIFFILIWSLKNILVSGCLLYPLSFTCSEKFEWSDKYKAKQVSVENEAWAKGWPDFRKKGIKVSQENYSKKFYWVETWLENHFMKILELVLPYLIFLVLLFFLIKEKYRKRKLENHIKYLILPIFLGLILWFIKVPVFRYGYSYLLIFICSIFAHFCSLYLIKNYSSKILKSLILILFIFFCTKNIFRIYGENDKYYNYPWPKYYSNNKNNQLNEPEFKIINGKKIFYVTKGYCMYGYSPCGQFSENLMYKKIYSYSLFYKLLN